MRKFLLLAILPLIILSGCNTDPNTYAIIETSMGDIKVMLYPETPKHKANFTKLANEGYYDETLFHRVIPSFMIQGGDPDSKTASKGQPLGSGGPGYMIDAEIGAPHIRGALAAARNNNPQKASSGSQFYIVTGTAQSDATIDQIERTKGIKYNEAQRELYRSNGGRPDLDNEYTVFGEVIEGMDVVDKIANAARAPGDRPNEDIKMNVRIVD
jgi:peptidyl-prolyl cis-trans isomerase B (cyclophilin B)